MTDHRSIEVAGVRLAYRVSGPPAAPPLVLLHALGEDASDWDVVAPALAGDRRVYALDLRGHGHSGRPGTYSLELMRDDVLGFLDALGLDRVDLIGHSLGGVVAYLLAQDRPGRVRRLLLEDVPAPLSRTPTTPTRPAGTPTFDWAMVTAVRPQLDTPDPAWLDGLARITAETLIVAGGPSSHIPQAGITELAHRIPNARVLTIPAGHFVHATEPAAFTEAAVMFLGTGGNPAPSSGPLPGLS